MSDKLLSNILAHGVIILIAAWICVRVTMMFFWDYESIAFVMTMTLVLCSVRPLLWFIGAYIVWRTTGLCSGVNDIIDFPN